MNEVWVGLVGGGNVCGNRGATYRLDWLFCVS